MYWYVLSFYIKLLIKVPYTYNITIINNNTRRDVKTVYFKLEKWKLCCKNIKNNRILIIKKQRNKYLKMLGKKHIISSNFENLKWLLNYWTNYRMFNKVITPVIIINKSILRRNVYIFLRKLIKKLRKIYK